MVLHGMHASELVGPRLTGVWGSLNVTAKMRALDTVGDLSHQWVAAWKKHAVVFDRAGCNDGQVKHAWLKLLSEDARKHVLIVPQRWMNADVYSNSRCNFEQGDWIVHLHGVNKKTRHLQLVDWNRNSTCF